MTRNTRTFIITIACFAPILIFVSLAFYGWWNSPEMVQSRIMSENLRLIQQEERLMAEQNSVMAEFESYQASSQ